jgi:hypothetical protein
LLKMAQEPSEWRIDIAHASPGKFKKFAGKYGREYASLFANLDKIMGLLAGGQKLGSFQVGFFRSEREGVYRIGQTGVRSAKESRLYVYPDEQKRIMYVLNIGTKEGQAEDINEAHRTARSLKTATTQ